MVQGQISWGGGCGDMFIGAEAGWFWTADRGGQWTTAVDGSGLWQTAVGNGSKQRRQMGRI
jgi:hypothetical protein